MRARSKRNSYDPPRWSQWPLSMVPTAVCVARGVDAVCSRLGWRYEVPRRLMPSAPQSTPAHESECSELRAQSSSLIVCVPQPAPSNASEGPLVSGRARLRAALAPHGRALASHTHNHGLNLYWGLSRGRASSFSVRSPLTCHNVAAKLYAGSSTTCLACFVFRVDMSRLPACDIPALLSRSQLRRRRCVCPAVA